MLSFFSSSSSSFLSLVYFFLSRLLLFQFTPHSVFCFFFFFVKEIFLSFLSSCRYDGEEEAEKDDVDVMILF